MKNSIYPYSLFNHVLVFTMSTYVYVTLWFLHSLGMIKYGKLIVFPGLEFLMKLRFFVERKINAYGIGRMYLLLPRLGVEINSKFESDCIKQYSLDYFDRLCLLGKHQNYFMEMFYEKHKELLDLMKMQSKSMIITTTHSGTYYLIIQIFLYLINKDKTVKYYFIAASTEYNHMFTPLIKLARKRGFSITLIGVFENNAMKMKEMAKDMRKDRAVCFVLHDVTIDLAKKFVIDKRAQGIRYAPVKFANRQGFYSDAVLRIMLLTKTPALAIKSYYKSGGSFHMSISKLSYEQAKENPNQIVQKLADNTLDTMINFPAYARWERLGILFDMEK